MNKINGLPPFKRFCVTIGNLPSSYVDSMSYYECIMWLCNYLKNTVVPAVNENAEAVNELINWFNNLDVQDEVDHKLDEMVTSGELQEIISEYLNSQAVFGYDTVSEMISSENLINGSYARTLGYNNKNDGGSGIYKIRTVTNEDSVDGGSLIAMEDTSLVAELIFTTAEVNIKQFGAVGDGITDDTAKIGNAIEYAKANNMKLTSPSDNIYLISESLEIDDLNIDFNYSTLTTNSVIDLITIESTNYYGEIKNITLDLNSIATSGIKIINGRKKDIHNVNMVNVTKTGLYFNNGYEINFHDSHITGNENSINAVGIDLYKGDSHFTDIIIIDCNIAVRTRNVLNYLTRIHAWILNYQNLVNSKFIDITAKCILFMNQCYSDTYQYTIYQEEYASGQNNPQVFIDQLSVAYNQNIYSQEHYDQNPYILHLQNNDQTQNISIVNSFMQGNYAVGLNTEFCNTSEYYGELENNIYSNLTKNTDSSIKNVVTGLTAVTNNVKKEGHVVTINAVFSYDSSTVSGTKILGILDYFYRPQTAINTACFTSNSQWATNPDDYELTYLYIDSTNVQAKLPSGSGTKYLHINITYVV